MNLLKDVGLPFTLSEYVNAQAEILDKCKPKVIKKMLKKFNKKKILDYQITYAICSTYYYNNVVKGKIKRKDISKFPSHLADLRRLINSNLELMSNKELKKLEKKIDALNDKYEWRIFVDE